MTKIGEITIPGDLIDYNTMVLPAESTELLGSLMLMAAEKCKHKRLQSMHRRCPQDF
jgi:hypothetical protein